MIGTSFSANIFYQRISEVSSISVVQQYVDLDSNIIVTLKVRISKLLHQQIYESFILEKLLRDLYVDDLVSSFNKEKQAFQFCKTSKSIISMGRYELRK